MNKEIIAQYNIRYIECKLQIKDLSQCCINGISSTAQTIKNLPFLINGELKHYWNIKIDLKTGTIVNWPKHLNVDAYFEVYDIQLNAYNENNLFIMAKVPNDIPKCLQLDLINKFNCINISINNFGSIKNWIGIE